MWNGVNRAGLILLPHPLLLERADRFQLNLGGHEVRIGLMLIFLQV